MGTWDSPYRIGAVSKFKNISENVARVIRCVFRGSVSTPTKPHPRECLRSPKYFHSIFRGKWRVRFRLVSSSCFFFLSFFLFRSPLRNHRRKSSYSHWITLTFTTLSASTISSSSSSTLHGMFRFCHLFLLFFVPGWCLLYLSWSVTFASTLF